MLNKITQAEDKKLSKKLINCHNTKLTFPIASKPLSKKNITPRNEKNIPKPVNPNPISVHVSIANTYIRIMNTITDKTRARQN